MSLEFIFKNKGFGIRRPKFNLALHKWLGHSETLFSPAQIENVLFSHNILRSFLKKKKEEAEGKKGKLQWRAKPNTVLAIK